MRRFARRAFGLGIAALCIVSLIALPSHAATTKNVSIVSYSFTPGSLSIHIGDTVVWKNDDNPVYGSPHTATSNDGTTFDSGDLNPGQSFTFTFTKAGTFAYHCAVHPTTMHGTITVIGASTSPTPTARPTPTPTHTRPKPTATAAAKPTAVPVSPTPTSSVKPSPRVSAITRTKAPAVAPSSTPGRALAAGTSSSSSQAGLTIGLIAGALVVLAGGLFFLRKRRTLQ